MKVAVSIQVLQATMPAIMSHFLEYLQFNMQDIYLSCDLMDQVCTYLSPQYPKEGAPTAYIMTKAVWMKPALPASVISNSSWMSGSTPEQVEHNNIQVFHMANIKMFDSLRPHP